MSETGPTCMLVGAGRAGNAIARAMHRKGYRFSWIGSLSVSHAAALANAVKSPEYGSPPSWPSIPDILLITVPDSDICNVAGSIASSAGSFDGTVALHLSGSLGSDVLDDLRVKGADTAAFHPCQTITADAEPLELFHGICFDMEGDDTACECGRKIAKDIGATSVRLTPEKRLLVHSAMTVGSNYTVVVFHVARMILAAGGIDEETARSMLVPLFERTARNIVDVGTVKALTGPVVRGDAEIVRRHMEVLTGTSHEIGELYRMLGLQAIEIVRGEGTLSTESLEKLTQTLERRVRR